MNNASDLIPYPSESSSSLYKSLNSFSSNTYPIDVNNSYNSEKLIFSSLSLSNNWKFSLYFLSSASENNLNDI